VSRGERRAVRVAREVFEDLEGVPGAERGPHGEPSFADFLSIDLLEIVETFATRFDDLPRLIDGRDDYRVLIAAGTLVRALSVVAQLATDDSVDVVAVDLDL
jgi:hypothetical protein